MKVSPIHGGYGKHFCKNQFIYKKTGSASRHNSPFQLTNFGKFTFISYKYESKNMSVKF